MKKRNGSFLDREGVALGTISLVALLVAALISLSFDTGAPDETNAPASQIAAE